MIRSEKFEIIFIISSKIAYDKLITKINQTLYLNDIQICFIVLVFAIRKTMLPTKFILFLLYIFITNWSFDFR